MSTKLSFTPYNRIPNVCTPSKHDALLYTHRQDVPELILYIWYNFVIGIRTIIHTMQYIRCHYSSEVIGRRIQQSCTYMLDYVKN